MESEYGPPIPDYAKMAATLEAAGYTVTPPDPLAAGREFLAGLFDVFVHACAVPDMDTGLLDDTIPAAMEYLRANKEKL